MYIFLDIATKFNFKKNYRYENKRLNDQSVEHKWTSEMYGVEDTYTATTHY